MGIGGAPDTSEAPGDTGEEYEEGTFGFCINEKEGITKTSQHSC